MNGVVLVVDDSLTVRMDLVEALTAAGIDAVPCASLAEARATLRAREVALVVLDVVLPDGDGTDFLKTLRGRPASATTPVLMLSSEAEVRDRVRALRIGADDYLAKPYERFHLVGRVRELLRRRGGAAGVLPARADVLLVDDSRTFREALAAALRQVGYAVRTAHDGEQGLLLAHQEAPAIFVVDLMMPGLDGAEVIRRVRLDPTLRDIPCLLLTAAESEAVELGALEAGADGFARKDEEIPLLLARIGAALRSAYAKKESELGTTHGAQRLLLLHEDGALFDELAPTLRGDGFDVVSARSPDEALELLAVQEVDCLLLEGRTAATEAICRRLKNVETARDVPLVVLTGADDRPALVATLSSGADDYVARTTGHEVLRARVRAHVRRKQFADEQRHRERELARRELEAAEARASRDLALARAALVEELEHKNKELEAFTYSVSHDLRAPLRSIAGFSEVLVEDYAGVLDDRGRDYLRRVCAAARRMDELIDDMLQLSQVGRSEVVRRQVDVADLAREVCEDLRQREPAREVVFEIQAHAPAYADPRLVRLLLENVLGNAWKFTAHAGQARIVFASDTDAAGDTIYLVRDNGAGFNMEHAARLFAPFQRLHTKDEFPGTGIGLATAKRIVDRHGGRIWAEGVPRKGATIYFTLPPPRPPGGVARPSLP